MRNEDEERQERDDDEQPLLPPHTPPFANFVIYPLIYSIVYSLFYVFRLEFVDQTQNRKLVKSVIVLALTAETIASVGYGDIVPNTVKGKVLIGLVVFLVHGPLCCWGTYFLTYLCYSFVRVMRGRMSEHRFHTVMGWLELVVPIVAPLVCLFVGFVGFYGFEGDRMSLGDSSYLAATTIPTVGYGDVDVMSDRGVIFASIWMAISTLVFAKCGEYLSLRIAKRLFGNRVSQ